MNRTRLQSLSNRLKTLCQAGNTLCTMRLQSRIGLLAWFMLTAVGTIPGCSEFQQWQANPPAPSMSTQNTPTPAATSSRPSPPQPPKRSSSADPPQAKPQAKPTGTPLYRVIALDSVNHGAALAVAINDAGTIVGWVANLPNTSRHRAVRWRNGSLSFIGPKEASVSTEAVAINDEGKIVGRAYRADGTSQGWVQNRDEITWLAVNETIVQSPSGKPVEPPSGELVEPRDINNLGQVVGSIAHPQQAAGYTDIIHDAFLWDAGNWRSVATGLEDPSVVATAINDVGRIAGYSTCGCVPARGPQSFVWDGATITELVGFGGDTRALAINNAGQVVGEAEILSFDGGDVHSMRHAFLWDQERMIDLGNLPGYECGATAVNDVGHVVGACETDGTNRAFVHDGRKMIDLNTVIPADSGWILQAAHDINNNGLIVGDGLYQGIQRAFLLRPTEHY